ncbi:MAG: LuxR C-terminal-related transcriptional regulator [Actinomycetota bacterium]
MTDGTHDPDPAALEREADERWWAGKLDGSLDLRQRAYAGYAAAADSRSAIVAVRLGFEHASRGDMAIAAGWLQRAQRDVADLPLCLGHGYVAMGGIFAAQAAGDLDAALASAERATEIGQRFGDRDLIAVSIHAQGRLLIDTGRIGEGIARLDEAMTSVIAGELGAFFTGVIYCSVLEACLDLGDVGRAGEWSDAAIAWCDAISPDAPFNALCRINRAQVAGMRGAWPEAESEASIVALDITYEPQAAGRAFYESGELRRRMGDRAGAEEAFVRARELGHDPQPGLALLRASQGKADTALQALRLSIAAPSSSVSQRARLLTAQVEVALAARDMNAAREATEGLEAIASAAPDVPALVASADMARGALCAAEGDVDGAVERLRRARSTWQELKLPYETALARKAYGAALLAAGAREEAAVELGAAASAFEQLGAAPDVAAVRALLQGPHELPAGLTEREAEVLRLVASGRTNRDIAVELVISEHTVARHLQNIFAKVGVGTRAAATAFAFEHDLA